ncbi:MAG: hypothetical protein AB7N76_06380 [Planctomycetota bacterium]
MTEPPPAEHPTDPSEPAVAQEGAAAFDLEPGTSQAEAAEDLDEEPDDGPRVGRGPLLGAYYAEQVEQAIACLGLAEAESAHQHLAEAAIWLALSNLDLELNEGLGAWLEGSAWAPLAPGRGPLRDPLLQRVALGLLLQRGARMPGAPAAARVAAALGAAALTCADPAAGIRLQRGFASLGLLPVTEQVPVALPVRALVLELRHLDLRAGVPAGFVARIEDLLDRLDATGLLGIRLSDHPDVREDERLPLWEALLATRAPTLIGLARLLFESQPLPDLGALIAALREDGVILSPDDEAARAQIAARYATVRARLAGTPFALLDPAQGYGLVSPGPG